MNLTATDSISPDLRNPMIYLDNAATSFPKPEPVYQALDQFARTQPGQSRPGRAPDGRGRRADAGRRAGMP